jgi:hypothetical protein
MNKDETNDRAPELASGSSATSWLAAQLSDMETRRQYERERLVVATANQIGQMMRDLELSRAELAKRLDRSRAYVTQVLAGDRNLTLRSLSDLGWAMGQRVELQFSPLSSLEYRPLDVSEPHWLPGSYMKSEISMKSLRVTLAEILDSVRACAEPEMKTSDSVAQQGATELEKMAA